MCKKEIQPKNEIIAYLTRGSPAVIEISLSKVDMDESA